MAFPPERDCSNWTLKDWLAHKQRVLYTKEEAKEKFKDFLSYIGDEFKDDIYFLRSYQYKVGKDLYEFNFFNFKKNLFCNITFQKNNVKDSLKKFLKTFDLKYQVGIVKDISHIKTGKDFDEVFLKDITIRMILFPPDYKEYEKI